MRVGAEWRRPAVVAARRDARIVVLRAPHAELMSTHSSAQTPARQMRPSFRDKLSQPQFVLNLIRRRVQPIHWLEQLDAV